MSLCAPPCIQNLPPPLYSVPSAAPSPTPRRQVCLEIARDVKREPAPDGGRQSAARRAFRDRQVRAGEGWMEGKKNCVYGKGVNDEQRGVARAE